MLRATYFPYLLRFKEPGGTSRGVLTRKACWLVRITDSERPEISGWGECALFRGLSADDRPDYERQLHRVCMEIDRLEPESLREWSSIRFGIETALLDLKNGGNRMIFPSDFSTGKAGIEINGLIWMGKKEEMQQRIVEKLNAGFRCIKLKIGAIDFEAELSLLKAIRQRFSPDEVELRVDANGAFTPDEAIRKLERLSRFRLHSIEQPIRQGQWEEMARLCRNTPIPIALDEELIGIDDPERKEALLSTIRPQYIILKPSLTGGFSGASEWIELARRQSCGWWITSALESNIGLNAIAQWTYTLGNPMPQGLGTGQLYTNNIVSPLRQNGSKLEYDPSGHWILPSCR